MSYVEKPSLVRVAGEKHGESVSAVGDNITYADLVWDDGTPVLEADLLVSQFALYKELIDEKIRLEAAEQRFTATKLVLGTEDMEQIRTYEEKYDEASDWLIDNNNPTPIMDAESAQTGETVASLAPLVVQQYDAAKAVLRQMYGNIEGIRRSNINIVSGYTTIAELEAYTGPTW